MTFAPDGRLFVCEQDGRLRVIKYGVLLGTPFLTLSNIDSSEIDRGNERGLLGVAVDPNFVVNKYVYVFYTAATPTIHNRVSRFTADGDVAMPGSEQIILELEDQRTGAGQGGAIHFGVDGKLYIVVGINTYDSYPETSDAQVLTNFWGKMLRINADGTFPSDNPFYNSGDPADKRNAIWARGLRVPFTFAVQPGTGRILINDVGGHLWEEINEGVAGANYGWPNSEGPASDPNYQGPIYYYGHGSDNLTGCAIIGGAFYNPATVQFPNEYVGKYFFADFCSGWIRQLDPVNGNSATDFAAGISLPVDLQVGPDGGLYYLTRGEGAVYKIQYLR